MMIDWNLVPWNLVAQQYLNDKVDEYINTTKIYLFSSLSCSILSLLLFLLVLMVLHIAPTGRVEVGS